MRHTRLGRSSEYRRGSLQTRHHWRMYICCRFAPDTSFFLRNEISEPEGDDNDGILSVHSFLHQGLFDLGLVLQPIMKNIEVDRRDADILTAGYSVIPGPLYSRLDVDRLRCARQQQAKAPYISD